MLDLDTKRQGADLKACCYLLFTKIPKVSSFHSRLPFSRSSRRSCTSKLHSFSVFHVSISIGGNSEDSKIWDLIYSHFKIFVQSSHIFPSFCSHAFPTSPNLTCTSVLATFITRMASYSHPIGLHPFRNFERFFVVCSPSFQLLL